VVCALNPVWSTFVVGFIFETKEEFWLVVEEFGWGWCMEPSQMAAKAISWYQVTRSWIAWLLSWRYESWQHTIDDNFNGWYRYTDGRYRYGYG